MIANNTKDQSLPWTGERYLPEVHGVIEIEHLHRYLLAKHLSQGMRVLDIACGEGYGSALLSQTAEMVIGVDISPEAVIHAQEKYKGNTNLEYRIGSCSAIPLESNSVDLVVSFETIEHHAEHELMMAEIKRVLRPGGMLVMSSPDKFEYSDKPGSSNPYHVKELYRSEFISLIEMYFKHHSISGQRVVYGSAIFSEESPSILKSYKMTDDSRSAICGVPDALYWIAIASDDDLPCVESGILELPVGDSEIVKAWIKEVSSRDAQIDGYRVQAEQFDLQLRGNKNLIAAHDQVVADREGQLSRIRKAVVEYEARIVRLNRLVASESEKVVMGDEQIVCLNRAVLERDEQIASLKRVLDERDDQLTKLRGEADRILIEHDYEVRKAAKQLNHMLESRCWRVMAPLRKAVEIARSSLSSVAKMGEHFWIRLDRFVENGARQIRDCPLFDAEYYLENNLDVKSSGVDPARHYLSDGWRENRDPSAAFCTSKYLSDNPDVALAGVNPLVHYLQNGRREGRLVRSCASALGGRGVPPVSLAGRPDDLAGDLAVSVSREKYLDQEIESIKQSRLFDEVFYRSMYPDVPRSLDAIRHYCEHGWREGRNPSDDFDTCFYLATYSDIRDAEINPFWHYVVAGASELRKALPEQGVASDRDNSCDTVIEAEVEVIKKSGLFDESFYKSMYPELQLLSCDALRHYCEYGWREGRDPSDDFDTRFYLATYSDIRDAGINPFLHYVVSGASEQRQTVPDSSMRFEDDIQFGVIETDIKLLAFYSSPDWAELRNGHPMSQGLSQSLLPYQELGFYDSRDWKILRRQAEMAKRHGLYGFCFPTGTATDRVALSSPAELFLAHDDIDFRFCVQADLDLNADLETLIVSLGHAVADPRYIRVQGRPVIVITLSHEMRNANPVFHDLRTGLTEIGVADPYLIARRAHAGDAPSGEAIPDLCEALLDMAGAPIPSETGGFLPMTRNGIDRVPYRVVASHGVTRARIAQDSPLPSFHCVTLGRDNRTSASERQLVYTRFHPSDYRRWLDAAVAGARIAHSEDRRFVFVNGWNDWNEGLFLEPDRKGGFSRLNETSRALLNIASGAPMPKVSVIVPNFNHEAFLRRRLDSIYGQTYKNIEVILLDDCSSDQSRSLLDQYAAAHPEITRKLYSIENSGGPFRQWAKGIKAATGDLVWVAESDDFCDERFLEVLVRCFDDEAVLLAYAKCVFVDKDEVPMRDEFKIHLSDLACAKKWNSSYVETAHNEVRCALGIKNTIPNASGVLFKRPIDMPLLDDQSWLSMVVAGDWVFYLQLIRGGKIAYSTDTTNFFRRYQGSAAEVTYTKEVFYREVGMASRTVAALYEVPLAVFEQCQKSFKNLYNHYVNRSDEEFSAWYDYESVLRSRENRLPNVMVTTMGFYPGGAEILPIRMANEFKRQGLSVLLLSTGLNPREEGVRRMLRNDVPLVETSDVEAVRSIIHEFGVEALNTHQWHIQKYPHQVPDVFSELGAHVASLHGMIEHGEAFCVTEEQLHEADRNVTTWVYTAEKNIAPFSQLGLYDESSSRFVKLPNGMQPPHVVPILRADLNIPEDAFVLCCVSRAIADKGWAETILVVERARALSGQDIRLILVGNGPIYDDYCRIGVPDFVCLAGFSENSVGYYAAADIGVMLTKFKSESFPLTIVDCLFAGKPYIASDVGDIRNMLSTSDDIAGEVIALEDWEIPIENAAQVVAAFATDKQKYANALAVVQEAANRYHIDVVASQYIKLFQDGCNGTRLRPQRLH